LARAEDDDRLQRGGAGRGRDDPRADGEVGSLGPRRACAGQRPQPARTRARRLAFRAYPGNADALAARRRLPRHRRRRAVRLRPRRSGLRRPFDRLSQGHHRRILGMSVDAPKLQIREIELYERPVTLRLPFRFGVVTLRECPQAFVRARVETEDGQGAWGASAEMMAPKWFDKDLALTNEQNFDQL